MSNTQLRYPNRLRKFRKIMNYSQIEVAHLMGHKKTTRICTWENGHAMPSVLNLIKLSAIYRTLMNEFYFDQYRAFIAELKAKTEKK